MLVADGGQGPLEGHDLTAPALLPSEVTSVLREMVYRGEMPAGAGADALAELSNLSIAYEAPGSLAHDASAIAMQLGWAKTYDAEYLALARRADCPMITFDERLVRGAGHLIDVRLPTDL